MKEKIANKKAFIRWKVYIDRARMYIGYVQFFMIGFVFLGSYRETIWGGWVFDHLLVSLPILLILFIVFSLILGRIDTLLGFREEELRNALHSNPVMSELLITVKELKEEVNALRKDQNKKEQ